jgi:hypothetical protein
MRLQRARRRVLHTKRCVGGGICLPHRREVRELRRRRAVHGAVRLDPGSEFQSSLCGVGCLGGPATRLYACGHCEPNLWRAADMPADHGLQRALCFLRGHPRHYSRVQRRGLPRGYDQLSNDAVCVLWSATMTLIVVGEPYFPAAPSKEEDDEARGGARNERVEQAAVGSDPDVVR